MHEIITFITTFLSSCPCHHGTMYPWVTDRGLYLHIYKVSVNMVNEHSST